MASGLRTYTIYHIPRMKVGLTINIELRRSQYPAGTRFKILEERVLRPCRKSAKLMGDKEWAYADKFGYERGAHYCDSLRSKLLGVDRSKFDFRTGVAGKASAKSQLANGTHISQLGKGGFFSGVAGKAGFLAQMAAGKHPTQQRNFKAILRRAQLAAISSPNRLSKKNPSLLRKFALRASKYAAVRCSCIFCEKNCTPGTLSRWHGECA